MQYVITIPTDPQSPFCLQARLRPWVHRLQNQKQEVLMQAVMDARLQKAHYIDIGTTSKEIKRNATAIVKSTDR